MTKYHKTRHVVGMGIAAIVVSTIATMGAVTPAFGAGLSIGDPVLDLKFEQDVADASPLAHPTKLVGVGAADPAYEFVDGVTAGSSALKLKGNTYLDLGASTRLQPANLTASFWLRPSATMTGEEIISWNKAAYNSDGWYLSSEGDSTPLALSIGPSAGQPYKVRVASADRNSFFPVGEWTHIVVTYNQVDKSVEFYRNGHSVPSIVANGIGGSSTGVLGSDEALPKTIGFNGPLYNGAFLGSSLDEYQLYDGVATRADVAELYESMGKTLDKHELAAQDAEGLVLPATATVALVLPSAGSHGSDITWKSSNPLVIDDDGIVARPGQGEDDAEVTLTATVRYLDGEAVTRTFHVLVPATTDPLLDSGLDVLLSDDYLSNAAAKEHEYLLSLSSEKFLYWFYKTAGLPPTTDSGYEGSWEDGSASLNFRGHAFGHYMSALAMSYASTDDPAVKAGLREQIVAAVNGLQKVQDSYAGTAREGYISPFRDTALDQVEGVGVSDDPVIVPYYNLHKVLAGLLEIDKYVEGAVGEQAMEIAEGFGEYLYGRVSRLSDTSTLLRTEYGGMNDALYDLYARTGNPHIKTAAEAFDEVSLFRDLAAGKDVLNGRHANTTIPKLIGALKRFTVLTQNPNYYDALTETEKAELPMYLNAAQNFWRIVVDNHSYATGANSQSEHFHGPDTLYHYATQMGAAGNPQTAETCNEYNMLKLSRELFKLTQDVKYADYYENTFINTIVSSQDPESGMTTYFQAMAPGYNKLYSLPFTDFWCCTGTGMENFSKLADSIYFTQRDSVYVNMFFSSSIDDSDTNAKITQQANLPNDNVVTFTVAAADSSQPVRKTELRLRKPDWLAGNPVVTKNGQPLSPKTSRGYLVIPELAAGDVVTYQMPMKVQVIDTPDNPDFVAFKYGPVLLSTGLGTANLEKFQPVGIGVRVASPDYDAQSIITVDTPTTDEWKADSANNIVRLADAADGQVRFGLENTLDGQYLVYTPHFQRHQERYGLYMNIEVSDSEAAQARVLAAKKKTRDLELNIDQLRNFDNNNFEAEKNMLSSRSQVGVFSERQYRDGSAGGWFSYDFIIDPTAEANFVAVDYFSGDIGRSFDVYLNDEKFKTEVINADAGPAAFYTQTDKIPAKYLEINDQTRYKTNTSGEFVLDENGEKIPVITVRFQSTGGYVGGVFGIATQRPAAWDTNPNLLDLSFDTGTLAPTFDSETKSYSLTVPQDTKKLTLSTVPQKPSGLVYVDGILIDDTLPRTIRLTDGENPVLELTSYAQDHETSTSYAVQITRGTEPTPSPTGPNPTDPGPSPTDPIDPSNPGAGSKDGPAITASKVKVAPGETIKVTGVRFDAGENARIELHSTPVLLDVVTADAKGGFVAAVTIPADTAVGIHDLVVTTASGTNLRVQLAVESSTVGGLPITGVEVLGLLTLAAILLGAGGLVIRRTRARDTAMDAVSHKNSV